MVATPVPDRTSGRAAQYVRMSTEHQRYSPMFQKAAIAAYAAAHGLEIVRTYADEAVSGLSMRHRVGLQTLLADIVGGQADFATVLVYDVSRWGRFQNPDQGAHYEFLCAEAGVQVTYCAETFDNDGSLSSTLLKSLKRVMAAEYSRELSAKVRHAQRRSAEMGFWLGGQAPFGLRRQTVGPDGRLGPIMELGDRKALQNHRIILVPGPQAEVLTVNRIFRLYAFGGLGTRRIAVLLNKEGLTALSGKPWNEVSVNSVVTNAAYVGDLEYGKQRTVLGGRQVRQPRAEWTVVKGAFEAVVPRRVFEAAQEVRQGRHPMPSPEDMFALMRRIYAEHGVVTFKLIRAAKVPGSVHFIRHYGGLRLACDAMGARLIDNPRKHRISMETDVALARLAAVYARHGYLCAALIRHDPSLPALGTYSRRCGGLEAAYAAVGFHPLRDAGGRMPANPRRALSVAVQRVKRRVLAARAAAERGDGADPLAAPEG
jgi:DNA invertase Pin-like site-specific DNA recombinase